MFDYDDKQQQLKRPPFEYDLEKEFVNNPEKCKKELAYYKSQFFALKRLLDLHPELEFDIKQLLKGYNAMGRVYSKGLSDASGRIPESSRGIRID